MVLYGMICYRSSLIRQSSHFERDFDSVLLKLADTLNTQFKYRGQLAFEHTSSGYIMPEIPYMYKRPIACIKKIIRLGLILGKICLRLEAVQKLWQMIH